MVRETLTCKNYSCLDSINDVIHDSWFDVNDINYDRHKGEVVFYFEIKERSLASSAAIKKSVLNKYIDSITPAMLLFKNVEEFTIVDSERVGLYDFNRILGDSSARLLIVETGIPITINIKVSDMDVRIEFADKKLAGGAYYRPW